MNGEQAPIEPSAAPRNWAVVPALPGKAATAAAALSAVALGGWAFHSFIAAPWLPMWDESFHHTWALRIWRDLVRLDLFGLLRDTLHQQLNPFIGSWIGGLALLVAGPAHGVTRAASLLAGFAGCAALGKLAADVAGENRWDAPACAVVLWAASPMFLFYASRSLLDAYALLATALCLIAVVRFSRAPSRSTGFAAGLLAGLTFLTKYNVGILLMAAIGLGLVLPQLIRQFRSDHRAIWEPYLRPWAVLVAMPVVCVAGSLMLDGARNMMGFLRAFPFYPLTPAEHLLFYPQALVEDYVAAPWLAAVPIATLLFWLLRGWGDAAVRVPLLYVLLNLAGATAHSTKDGRLIWGAVGVTFALTGALVARALARASARDRVILWTVQLAVFAAALWYSTSAALNFALRTQPASAPVAQQALTQALAFIRQNIDQKQPIFYGGMADWGVNPHMLRQALWAPPQEPEPDLRELPYAGGPAEFGYSPEPSPRYPELLRKLLEAEPSATLLLTRHAPGSAFRWRLYPWIFAWQENYCAAAQQLPGWMRVARLDTRAGLEVEIYRRQLR